MIKDKQKKNNVRVLFIFYQLIFSCLNPSVKKKELLYNIYPIIKKKKLSSAHTSQTGLFSVVLF